MASKKYLVPINLLNLAEDPASASEGDVYFNTADDVVKVYANGSWVPVGAANQDFIAFDTTPETIPTATGSLYWDSGDGVPAAVLNANVTIGLGQEQVALVKNATGASIAKGKVVYINGAQGQRPTITLSDADTEAASSKTFGLTAEAIADGAEGFVTTFGVLRGVNTDGLTEGAALWLSSTAGGYTTTIPAEPAHSVFLGYVVKANASSGEIFVNIQNGYELNELHGVTIDGTPADNELLAYDSTSGLWINQTASEAGLQTVVSGVSDTEIGYLDGVTSAIQTQIDGKISASSSDTLTNKVINLGTGITSIAGYDDISGFYGQNDIAIYGAGVDRGGRINISSVGDITITNPGIGYTNGLVTTSGGTRFIITVGGNVLTGTLAEFNNSLTDANFATLTGAETLTNKTLTSPKINEDVALTATSTELNVLDGITASTAELNILDGITSTAAELNILDGATLTTTELNYVDGVTSAIQTQLNEKLDTSATAQTKAGDLTITGNLTVNGTTTTINSTAVNVNNQVIFEGATANGFETTLTSIDPTADNTISLPNASGTIAITTDLDNYQPIDADLTAIAVLTGTSGILTKDATNSWSLDTNTYVTSTAIAGLAPIASPEFTGSPLATTATAGDNSTKIATTAFVATSFAPIASPTFTGAVTLPALTSIGNVLDTEIAFLDGVTSNIQTQLDSKPTMTAGIISDTNLSENIARVDDISNSTTGYVPVTQKGVADGIATLDSGGKVPPTQLDLTSYATLSGGATFTGTIILPSTTTIGSVTNVEIGYLDGVTSSIQTQLGTMLTSATAEATYLSKADGITLYQPKDGDLTAIAALTGTSGILTKAGTDTWTLDTNTYLTTSLASSTYLQITTAATTYAPKAEPTFTGTVVLPSTTSIGDVSATEIGYLDGVTSAIQTQISSKASTGHTHSYQDADSDLTAIAGITSGVGLLKRLGPDTWTIDTSSYITGSSPTISTSLIAGTSTFNLINSIATTVNFAGGATTLIMGATDAGATTTIRTPAINTASTSLDLFNTTATTVNFAGASTTFNLGGTPTGTLTATLFGNATTTTKTINIGTGGASGSETNINIGSSTSGATGTVSVYPSTNFVGTVTVPTPTSSGHATTKSYVDALAAGVTVKAQVVYVSSANLNATYANGTSDSSGGLGVGATLTGNVDGALILDGPEVEAGQRVLIKDQTNKNHNGIYVVTFAGDGDDPFILTRATDFNGNTSTNGIIKNGAYIFVTSGTTSANDSYVVSLGGTSTTPSGAIKIGTDNIVLAQYSGVPNNISTLGYVTTGTWAATPIDKDYIDVEIARTNDPVFTGHVTVPDPTDDTDATSKQYVDDLIFASLPYLPDIIPLDDLRYEFNDMDSRFIPKFQGEKVAINNPLRLLVTINGIIQTVDFPEYVWQSMLPREGFMVDSDGYIAFSEVPPVGSTFDARLMLGPNVNSIKKGYPFKAVDILLGA